MTPQPDSSDILHPLPATWNNLRPKGLRGIGSPGTKVIPLPKVLSCGLRVRNRLLTKEEFIELKGSGTLRKNHRIGMNIQSHYLHERVAYEFGYYFEICPERFVTWGEARSEGDCHAITEVGWHVERYASMVLFPGDEIECKYLIVEDPGGDRKEGVGLVYRRTSAPWVPGGYMVYCIITEWDPVQECFKEAVNPC